MTKKCACSIQFTLFHSIDMCFRVTLLGVISCGGRKGSMTFSLETKNEFIYIKVYLFV